MRRGRTSGQAVVEFALVLPLFLTLVVGMIECGRLVYLRGVLQSDARDAARLAANDILRASDCPAWSAGTDSGGGIVQISVDPHSTWNNGAQLPPSGAPGPNRGYLYIQPAAATAAPGGCPGRNSCAPACAVPINDSETVTATETYDFHPWVPLPGSVASFVISVSDTEQVQRGPNG